MFAKIGYFAAGLGVLVGAIAQVRVGALLIAIGLALVSIPKFEGNWSVRRIDVLIPAALIVALITIAFALPRAR
ncbi:hypothetical protein LBMAG09_03890 [Actinomycetes bacterium]|nr:hypothetical protein LBMAG09_03890 [Actinomycetes bacterium]